MRSRRLALIALILLAFVTVPLAADPADAQTAPKTTKINFRLDWKPGAQHLPFYYAKEKGYYAQEGIDLEIISGSGSADSVKTLGTRAVELALVDALVLVQAREQQMPVQTIAAYYQRTPICLISPLAKPIKTAQEMLRHANSRITADICQQCVSEEKRQAQGLVFRGLLEGGSTQRPSAPSTASERRGRANKPLILIGLWRGRRGSNPRPLP